MPVYQNFNRQAQRLLPLVEQYLADLCLRSSSKIVIADSTPLPVCKYWRAYRGIRRQAVMSALVMVRL
ncbi:MAG: hypothetical protein OXF49_00775 [Candidatus Saccharibacteria bacterium]|nr:hypothetical protein [Candidatus Saccharibacteria bacterium]